MKRLKKSAVLREATRLALKSLSSKEQGPIRELVAFLRKRQYADPLLILMDQDVRRRSFPARLGSSRLYLDDWLLNINDWIYDYLAPRQKSQRENLLYALWSYFAKDLEAGLQEARHSSGIPARGGLTAFVAGLRRCIVMDYSFHGELVQVSPVAVVPDPTSIFDIWTEVERVSDASAKNALKRILGSGHKIVYHRGVVVHVDRRSEEVFGPTIDTVLLAETMVQVVAEAGGVGSVERSLEIGSGSGLMSAVLLRNLPSARDHVALDCNFASVACTEKNCEQLRGRFDLAKVAYVASEMDPSMFRDSFDLCICNPPYVPLPPVTGGENARFADNHRAAGGTDLLEMLACNLNPLLSPRGRLVLVTSSLSLPIFERLLPREFSVHHPLGREGFAVPFDVDSVVTDDGWVQFLERECGLKRVGRSFEHRLHPVVVNRGGRG